MVTKRLACDIRKCCTEKVCINWFLSLLNLIYHLSSSMMLLQFFWLFLLSILCQPWVLLLIASYCLSVRCTHITWPDSSTPITSFQPLLDNKFVIASNAGCLTKDKYLTPNVGSLKEGNWVALSTTPHLNVRCCPIIMYNGCSHASEFSPSTSCDHTSDMLCSINISHRVSKSFVMFFCEMFLDVAYNFFNYLTITIRYYMKAIVYPLFELGNYRSLAMGDILMLMESYLK